MQLSLPYGRVQVSRRATQGKKEVLYEVLEEEVPMSQQDKDAYAQLVGDGNARITVSREASESSYGTGGKVFVSVSLACHQDQKYIESAIGFATSLADHYMEKHYNELQQKLVQMGVLKPGHP